MKYYKGYKYVVAKTFSVQTAILGFTIQDKLTSLRADGTLTIQQWYPWDGNSGPVFDVASSIEASCVHDVLCDYINMDWLPGDLQPLADQEYYKKAVTKGMWWRKARVRMLAIRWYMTGKGAKRFTREVFEA
jgi:hypothetical protein